MSIFFSSGIKTLWSSFSAFVAYEAAQWGWETHTTLRRSSVVLPTECPTNYQVQTRIYRSPFLFFFRCYPLIWPLSVPDFFFFLFPPSLCFLNSELLIEMNVRVGHFSPMTRQIFNLKTWKRHAAYSSAVLYRQIEWNWSVLVQKFLIVLVVCVSFGGWTRSWILHVWTGKTEHSVFWIWWSTKQYVVYWINSLKAPHSTHHELFIFLSRLQRSSITALCDINKGAALNMKSWILRNKYISTVELASVLAYNHLIWASRWLKQLCIRIWYIFQLNSKIPVLLVFGRLILF